MRQTFLFLMILLSVCQTAGAQQTSDAKDRVAQIRKIYNQAKQEIAKADQLGKQGKPSNRTVVNSSYKLGTSPGMNVVTYYYNGVVDEYLDRYLYRPYFITNNFDTPGNKYYQEFLFDNEENLIFYYEKNEGQETRLYFDPDGEHDDGGLVYEINTSSRTMEPPFAIRVAGELMHAFHLLMNREF